MLVLKHTHLRSMHRGSNTDLSQGSLVQIHVPGLIERRPEIVYGDKVRIR